MDDRNKTQAGWKRKIMHEVLNYWFNFVYLAVFFGVFMNYRRLVLEEYGISYLHYGIGVIEAAVLAKVIMIGDVVRLGRRHEDRPLIVPTLYKTTIFSLWAALFKILEEFSRAILEGKGAAGGVQDMLSGGWYEIMSQALVIFTAFVPFFAFRELGRVLGGEKLGEMFFRKRPVGDATGET